MNGPRLPQTDHHPAILMEARGLEEQCHALLARWPAALAVLDTSPQGRAGRETTRGMRSERTPAALRVADQAATDRAAYQEARAAWDRAEALRWSLLPAYEAWIHRRTSSLVGASTLEHEDLVQEGRLGFLRACRRFDPDAGVKLLTYAAWWVRAGVTRAIENTGRQIVLPPGAGEQFRVIRRVRVALGPDATEDEIAAEAGVSVARMRMLIRAAARPLSMDAPLGDDDLLLADTLSDDAHERLEEAIATTEGVRPILDALAELPEQERTIITRRFGLNGGGEQTLKAIGEHFGRSRERIRQLERDALQQLRAAALDPSPSRPEPASPAQITPTPETPMQPCLNHPDARGPHGLCVRCWRVLRTRLSRHAGGKRTSALPGTTTHLGQAILRLSDAGMADLTQAQRRALTDLREQMQDTPAPAAETASCVVHPGRPPEWAGRFCQTCANSLRACAERRTMRGDYLPTPGSVMDAATRALTEDDLAAMPPEREQVLRPLREQQIAGAEAAAEAAEAAEVNADDEDDFDTILCDDCGRELRSDRDEALDDGNHRTVCRSCFDADQDCDGNSPEFPSDSDTVAEAAAEAVEAAAEAVEVAAEAVEVAAEAVEAAEVNADDEDGCEVIDLDERIRRLEEQQAAIHAELRVVRQRAAAQAMARAIQEHHAAILDRLLAPVVGAILHPLSEDQHRRAHAIERAGERLHDRLSEALAAYRQDLQHYAAAGVWGAL